MGDRRGHVLARHLGIPAEMPDLPGRAPGPVDRAGTVVLAGGVPALVTFAAERTTAVLRPFEAEMARFMMNWSMASSRLALLPGPGKKCAGWHAFPAPAGRHVQSSRRLRHAYDGCAAEGMPPMRGSGQMSVTARPGAPYSESALLRFLAREDRRDGLSYVQTQRSPQLIVNLGRQVDPQALYTVAPKSRGLYARVMGNEAVLSDLPMVRPPCTPQPANTDVKHCVQWSRPSGEKVAVPTLPPSLGVRPNSPVRMINVSSSMPSDCISPNSAATARSKGGNRLCLRPLAIVRVRIPLAGHAHVGLHDCHAGLQHAPRQQQRLPEHMSAVSITQLGGLVIQRERLGQPAGQQSVAGGLLLAIELLHRGVRRQTRAGDRCRPAGRGGYRIAKPSTRPASPDLRPPSISRRWDCAATAKDRASCRACRRFARSRVRR